MFGNHPLPNIAPSLLSFSPPPTYIPPPPPSQLPLANARTGQARACSSTTPTHAHCPASPASNPPPTPPPRLCPSPRRGMWPNDTPRHCAHPPARRSLPTATPNRHVTAARARVRHVTAPDDPHLPPHHRKAARTPRHGRRRPVEEARSREGKGKRSEEGREGERRGRGNGRGRGRQFMPPPSLFFHSSSQRAGV